jgi:hypothetical protein
MKWDLLRHLTPTPIHEGHLEWLRPLLFERHREGGERQGRNERPIIPSVWFDSHLLCQKILIEGDELDLLRHPTRTHEEHLNGFARSCLKAQRKR